jgi:hypothetical protein
MNFKDQYKIKSEFKKFLSQSQNHSNYSFNFDYVWRMFYTYSNLLYAHSKYSVSNIIMNPLFLLVYSKRDESIG